MDLIFRDALKFCRSERNPDTFIHFIMFLSGKWQVRMKGRPIFFTFLLLLFSQPVLFTLPSQESMSSRQLLENLKTKEFKGAVMNLDFDSADLNQIFQRFESISGLDFIVDPTLKGVGKFSFKGIEWDRSLHLVLMNLELELQLDGEKLKVIKARSGSGLFSVFFLTGVLSSILLVISGIFLVYSMKKRYNPRLNNKPPLNSNPPLPDDRIEEIIKGLVYVFEVEKIHRNEALTLDVLADRLAIPSHQLSWIINNKIGKTFSTLLNHYRIEEVKKGLADPLNSDRSILEIAFSSGFNTKSSFNKTFKTLTGKTPRDYRAGKGG